MTYSASQIEQFRADIVRLRELIAKENGPTHNFFFYTARLNERERAVAAADVKA